MFAAALYAGYSICEIIEHSIFYCQIYLSQFIYMGSNNSFLLLLQRIPLLNRAQIINDVWNLVKAGELSVGIALPSLEYLDSEADYVPWVSAMNEVGYLSDMLGETEAYGDFQVRKHLNV